MGNESSKSWIGDNVVFFDFNRPPFRTEPASKPSMASRHGLARKKDGKGTAAGSIVRASRKALIKRTVPSERDIRSRTYRVMVYLNGLYSEFQIKCKRENLTIVLSDREGIERRSLPACHLSSMERAKDVVTCIFRIPQPLTRSEDKELQLKLQFFDHHDTQSFIDTVKLLFGIYVTEYGVTKPEVFLKKTPRPQDSQNTWEQGMKLGRMQREVIFGPENQEQSTLEQLEALNTNEKASKRDKYPISIKGSSQCGAVLQWIDMSPMSKKNPPKTVEWCVSVFPGYDTHFLKPGNQKDFASGLVTCGETLELDSRMIGKFIKLIVMRKVDENCDTESVVRSTAIKGPVTVNDIQAKAMMEVLATPRYQSKLDINPLHLKLFFPNKRKEVAELARMHPFVSCCLVISRAGLEISVSRVARDPAFLPWNCFYPSRSEPSENEFDADDELCFSLNVQWTKEKKLSVCFFASSELERDSIYNAIWFYKIQKSFKGFDRWDLDLDQGNYAVIKQRYAKLWRNTRFFADIVETLTTYEVEDKSAVQPEELIFDSPGNHMSSLSDSGGNPLDIG